MTKLRCQEVGSQVIDGLWETVIWEVQEKHKFYVVNVYRRGEPHKPSFQPPWYESVNEAKADMHARVIEHSVRTRWR